MRLFVPMRTGSEGPPIVLIRPFFLPSVPPAQEAIMEEKKFYLNITTQNEEGKKETKTVYVSEEVYRADVPPAA